ncbi:MAG TPA: Fe-S cluster assembly protein SufD [Acidobacteriota bacterium]|nr:Fe-S cluster assembly protein SufD [Acidobacteriota bacterium]
MSTGKTEYTIPDAAPALEQGPLWLRQKRRSLQESFNSTPLPRRGLHLWRYTDPAKFLAKPSEDDTPFGDHHDAVEEIELEHLRSGHLAGLVTDLGGRQIKSYGLDQPASQGLVVMPLSKAVEQHHDLVEPYLYGLVNSQTGKMEAMNGALWNDGIFIFVPDNRVVEKPIHLLREAGPAGSVQYPRLLVVVGRNAELTLIDEYGGGSSNDGTGLSYANAAVEMFGLAGSRTRYVTLQRQGPGMRAYLTHRARIERGANMLTIPLVFGATLCKQNFGVIMNGQGAESKMYGLLFGTGHQHFDNHTLHHHAHGQTVSNIDFKVVLRDRAQSAYTGLIRIDRHARVCEAYQENRNLLLSPGTRAETIPELEILNEDVSCSHGATLGPVDPDSIFYLASRGISRDQAVRMLVSGFVAPTLKLVPDDLRDRITAFVLRRLEDM